MTDLEPVERVIPAPGQFRILALSGGGYRGLFAAGVLARLDARFRPPIDGEAQPGIAVRAHLFAGTSVGGLLAAGLALGRSATDLRDTMLAHGPQIFDDRITIRGRRLPVRNRLRRAYRSKFGRAALETAIAAVLGSDAGRKIGELPTLMLIAVCATTGAPFFMSGLDPEGPGAELTLSEALIATSAAPTYFPPLNLELRTLVDGGLVANAPELAAAAQAIRRKKTDLAGVRILSIGTASPDAATPPRALGARGLAGWARGLVPLTLEAQETLAVLQSEALLGDHYLRINASPAPAQSPVLALDRATEDATATLQLLALNAANAVDPDDLRRIGFL